LLLAGHRNFHTPLLFERFRSCAASGFWRGGHIEGSECRRRPGEPGIADAAAVGANSNTALTGADDRTFYSFFAVRGAILFEGFANELLFL